jgi:hypothetical protein
MGSFRSFVRVFRGAGVAGRGRRALRAGRRDEGRQLLRDALALLGCDQPRGIADGVWFSQRFMALRGLSVAAAGAGDEQEATDTLMEGIALWKEMNLPPSPKYAFVDEWLSWGDAYLRHARLK